MVSSLEKCLWLLQRPNCCLFQSSEYRMVLCVHDRNCTTQRDRNDRWKNRKIFYPVHKHLESCRKSNKKWLPSKKLKHPSNEMNNQTDIWYPLPLNQVFLLLKHLNFWRIWPCKLPCSQLCSWADQPLWSIETEEPDPHPRSLHLPLVTKMHSVSPPQIFCFSFLYRFLLLLCIAVISLILLQCHWDWEWASLTSLFVCFSTLFAF